MKKILLFLILLLIPCIVMADEEVFVETTSNKVDDNFITFEKYKDGYVTAYDIYENNTFAILLKTSNNKGEVIKSVDVGTTTYPIQIIVNNDDIYLFRYYNGRSCVLELYNENLEKQNDIEIENCSPLFSAYVEVAFEAYAVIDNGYLYYYDDDGTVGKIKNDLSSYERINMSEEEIKELLPAAYYNKKIKDSLPSTSQIIYLDYNDDYIVANIIDQNDNCPENSEDLCNGQDVRIYDKDLNVVKNFNIIEKPDVNLQREALAVRIVQNYLLVSYISIGERQVYLPGENIPPFKGFIEVYDLDWNLVQTIEKEIYIPVIIKKTGTGFMTSSIRPTYYNDDDTPIGELTYYSIKPSIETPTIDHGRIIVPSNALAGETVTIEVKPDKGYTLGELIVMDANGNKLPVTNNTFVMGTSKVTVSALFVPENPNTGNLYVILICLIAAISGIVLITQKKKLDFLK